MFIVLALVELLLECVEFSITVRISTKLNLMVATTSDGAWLGLEESEPACHVEAEEKL